MYNRTKFPNNDEKWKIININKSHSCENMLIRKGKQGVLKVYANNKIRSSRAGVIDHLLWISCF